VGSAIDILVKGALGTGDPEDERDVRPARNGRARSSRAFSLRVHRQFPHWNRSLRKPVIVLLSLTAATIARAAPAAPEAAVFRCTNPASGASWDIKVDFARNFVDAFPADISERWISWHDTAHGGLYDLDRTTGELTVRFASSTGGYFLYDKCRAG
jgi:hypothetical protein